VRFTIERKDKEYTAIEPVGGWKIVWLDENACGVSPRLAFSEALYVLSCYERMAETKFDEVHEHLKKAFNGQTFRIELVSFPHKPTVQMEALYDGTQPPTLIHSIFASIQENRGQPCQSSSSKQTAHS
jgi:hypothetical protein